MKDNLNEISVEIGVLKLCFVQNSKLNESRRIVKVKFRSS